MSASNRDVVLRFIHAMSEGDREAAIPCLTTDVVTIAKGYSQFAGERRFEKITGTIGAFKQLIPTGLRPVIHRILSDGDTVIVEWEGNGVTYTGTPYCNQYCMLFDINDGRIQKVTEYFCTLHADTVLWPLIQQASATQNV